MLPVKVNADCIIVDGPLKGTKGKVVSFDYFQNIVEIMVDTRTYITTVHENVEQVIH